MEISTLHNGIISQFPKLALMCFKATLTDYNTKGRNRRKSLFLPYFYSYIPLISFKYPLNSSTTAEG